MKREADYGVVLGPDASSVRRPVLPFLALVFAFTAPFWLLGALTDLHLLPGLPVASLAVVCPSLAALILVFRYGGMEAVKALLGRAFDVQRIGSPLWLLPALLIAPGIAVLGYVIQRWLGAPIPAPDISVASVAMLVLMFFPAALAEELGWSGYATEPLQNRFGELGAGLLLGIVWSVWHLPALVQAHRSLEWIAWWCLGTVAARLIMVWLFNRTGRSVFAIALYHTASNLSWQLYPVQGSYFDPRIDGLTTAALASVLVLWSLSQRRSQRARATT